ncbi:hypothetical protein NQ315_004573 [Exocentrus adspersus]|uniref:RING-type E3 ubiquitin transferase n=1 Tax=Exocentrus adspersus TaxID=1586481 RepID=A0AAV8VPP3_9CUCU|nr:hypothetical protein NQ315_004573 [Exocentrus adspersus]
MYIKIRMLSALLDKSEIILNVSKMDLIQDLREKIEKEFKVTPEQQILLYKGKQLVDGHRVLDYNICLNDVIQLMTRYSNPTIEHSDIIKKDNELLLTNNKRVTKDVESKFYKLGDLIDVRDEENGSWYEGSITKIFIRGLSSKEQLEESDIHFRIKGAEHILAFEVEARFDDIRPRSFYTYKISELKKGMIVLVNYNIEGTKSRGLWYDFKIEEVNRTSVQGTIMVGRDKASIENCSIKSLNEIMRIENPVLVAERKDECKEPIKRKYPYHCDKCKDVADKKCKECGCRICAGKNDWDLIVLCDECNYGYHTSCLNPPMKSVPEEDEWYCPDCKTDDNEIVKPGEKLKLSNKKSKRASNRGESSRDWGKGMACVGRTTECTIVPKDHYGPVPGVEVGTCWKFRLQVSEAGVHRPHVAGIHGRETDGAYSLVLSGGYEDDIDNGEEFYYTGSGGRDLSGNKRCSEQSCDQKLTRMNKALALNCNAPFNDQKGAESKDWKKGKPVRVVRNYKGAKHSKYAPLDGNRYDGLYKVVKYYPEKGKSGYIVWKYLLRRDDPNLAPWEDGGQELDMIYPPGYLEAQEAGQKKDKENKSKSPKGGRGLKRKLQVDIKPLTEFLNTSKKRKMTEYKLTSELEDSISQDKSNEKLWCECKEVLKEGKQKFLSKVEEIYMCICCQELVFEPVTTDCKHNICKACLKRSFASEIYTCPYCRYDLGKSYKMRKNEHLGKVLGMLFPGYEATR